MKLALYKLAATSAIFFSMDLLSADTTSLLPNNGVLPESAEFISAMKALNVKSAELLIKADSWSHKVVVFVYPTESGMTWVWDPAAMSIGIGKVDPCRNPEWVANIWMSKVLQRKDKISVTIIGCPSP